MYFQPEVDLQLDVSGLDASVITTARVLEHISPFKDAINIYTDGARSTSGRAASAFRIQLYDVTVALRLIDHCTAYAAELTAIYICIQWINTDDRSYFVIFSDTIGSLKSIRETSTTGRPRLLIDVLERQHDLHVNKQKRVQFVWIPAHINIVGHDAADRAAKYKLSSPEVELNVGIEQPEARSVIKEHVTSLWQSE